MTLADIIMPTTWFWPVVFGLVVTLIGWLARGKADRWDATSDRSHAHANDLATVYARLDAHEKRLSALEKE